MVDKKLLEKLPLKRLKPVDGTAVTAALWDEAHEYHRLQQRSHNLLQHGPGIVAGLEVIASDPPDSTIYVLPGVAIDPKGDLIVVQEPIAFDFGLTLGSLHLVLSYAESRPEQDSTGGPLYIRSQYGVEAVLKIDEPSALELARIRRTRQGGINDPSLAEFPQENEIDQRYRPYSGQPGKSKMEFASIAVRYTGVDQRETGHGIRMLASSLQPKGMHIAVDLNVPVNSNLEEYMLVYLVGQEGAGISRDQMNSLYAYLRSGGTLFMEACRQGSTAGAEASDLVFTELAASFGMSLEPMPSQHPLLTEPNLFGEPPAGFENANPAKLLVKDGLIFSSYDYGCLWQARRRGRAASREEIRSALEWGENLVHYAMARRQRATAK